MVLHPGSPSELVLGLAMFVRCKIFWISKSNSAVCSVPIVLYGTAGAEFYRARIIYCADWAVASMDDMCGFGNLRGKISHCH